MSVIDVDGLLEEISEEAPSGENLEYDPAFSELERAAEGKGEQQIGDEVSPAEEPDWRDVKNKAIELFGRGKHLRVAVHLARALLHTDGFPGFQDGLALLRGLLERHWDSVHPQLDPGEKNDPTERVNILTTIADPLTMLRGVRGATLISSKSMGRFSLRDIEVATGQSPAPAGTNAEPPDVATIEAAFKEVGTDELNVIGETVQGCIGHALQIESSLTEHVGASESVDLSDLATLLNTVRQVVLKHAGEPVPAAGMSESNAAAGPARLGANVGGVGNRDEVLRALDMVCEYYRQNEPSSPVPLLLERAKRLVSKDFVQIVQDLAPGGVNEINTIIGEPSKK